MYTFLNLFHIFRYLIIMQHSVFIFFVISETLIKGKQFYYTIKKYLFFILFDLFKNVIIHIRHNRLNKLIEYKFIGSKYTIFYSIIMQLRFDIYTR